MYYVMNSYISLSYEFILSVNYMNSYHIISIRIFQSIPITQTIFYMESLLPENRIVASVNILLRLTSDLNTWSSKFMISHGDQSIDVSSTAQGALSSSPSGMYPHQNIEYPLTKYHFDEQFFWGLRLRIYW